MTTTTALPHAAKPFAIVESDFADGTYKFGLSWALAAEWEKEQNRSLLATFLQAARIHVATISDIREIIRLGLIGAGLEPVKALKLVRTYVEERPAVESFPLMISILDAFLNGQPEAAPSEEAPKDA
ncbi:gene transfer agent family protein [Rhizobium leguminosarum]